MARWLVKTEPGEYSVEDLEREGVTIWDGVRNPLALKHMRAMRTGDEVLIYHTGRERSIVGVGTVNREAYANPADGGDAVDIAFNRRLAAPVRLAFLREQAELSAWELLRLPRLSVMPVPDDVYVQILDWAGADIKSL